MLRKPNQQACETETSTTEGDIQEYIEYAGQRMGHLPVVSSVKHWRTKCSLFST